ncbi:MAG: transglutaminase domain-containing protein [Defluviitaleaceae bacterium]|nr:transglutaminase domain-containing protein [Defluviitaleaceae bacterium]
MKKVLTIIFFATMLIAFTSCDSGLYTTPPEFQEHAQREQEAREAARRAQEAYEESLQADSSDATGLSIFHGQWESTMLFVDDTWTLNIDGSEGVILMSSEMFGVAFLPVDWEIEEDRLVISMNDEANRAIIEMVISDDGAVISGTYTQFEEITGIAFAKLSETPEMGEFFNAFAWETVSFEERMQTLADFALYEDDGTVLTFTYDLNRRDLYADLIEEFDLDTLTYGYSDVELMLVLLDWMMDNFRHNGASGMPEQRNAITIIDYMRENPLGINCRGLAILLAEVLRLYGIEAKHITVYPYEDNHPVHVITHAYSRRLNQWILLDPTFGMYVTDEYGNFMDLYMLRKAFAQGGTPILANPNATRNGYPVTIDEFKTFMVCYLFRFSTGTNFTFGSEEGADTTQVMLVPVGFTGTGGETTTSSASAFFATPSGTAAFRR